MADSSLVTSIERALDQFKKQKKERKNVGKGGKVQKYSDYSDDDFIHSNFPGYLRGNVGGGGGGGQSGTSGSKPTGTYNPSTAASGTSYSRKVAVIDEKQEVYATFILPWDCDGWFDIAKYVWPTEERTVKIPLAHCNFQYDTPSFNACVYNAANDYMQARWGRKLDNSDRDWLAAHQFATDSGIPQEYTATCISQLVEPYGMRVSRLRLRRGSLVLGESINAWIMALGCNPFAMADRSTSNAEAAERLGMSLADADAFWRVEFHDDPLPCSIVGERGWASSTGVATGSFGGHARYLAPRARGGDWFVSIQLDVDRTVDYLVAPPNPEYTPRRGKETLLVSRITGPDGKVIAERKNNKWTALGAVDLPAAVTTTMPATTPTTLPTLDDRIDLREPPIDIWDVEGVDCLMCNNNYDDPRDLFGAHDICNRCVEDVFDPYKCASCHTAFKDMRHLPNPVGVGGDTYTWQCSECKGEFDIAAEHRPDYEFYEMAELSFYVFYGRGVGGGLGDDVAEENEPAEVSGS
jgi:hypothetical protein